jgi:DNA mismatch repair protein MutS
MQIDQITFNDISIFHSEEEYSIFHKLNFTKTIGGKEWLRRFFSEPHNDLKRVIGTQNIIRVLLKRIDEWPAEITNGTIIMMEKFLDYNLDPVPEHPTVLNSGSYMLFHRSDYSMIRFSLNHFIDFYHGLQRLVQLFDDADLPPNLAFYIQRIREQLNEAPLRQLAEAKIDDRRPAHQSLYFAHHLRVNYKSSTLELIDIFSRLEAWYSMAMAVKNSTCSFQNS